MRISKDQYFLQLTKLLSQRSTCPRRHVGAVLVDSLGHVMATGYNGVPRGLPHCNESEENHCPGAKALSGTKLDSCYAIHAEQNALIQCSNVDNVVTCYSSAEPCIDCTKMLLNTGCQRVVFIDEYADSKAKELWFKRHDVGSWQQMDLEKLKND